MSEAKKPQWVRCGDCNHKWIGFYAPIEISKMTRIIRGMCCPSCAADSENIYMTQGGKDE